MPDRDDWVRDALGRLDVPPERDAFFAELWEQAQARERAAARRWRRVALALAVTTAAAISSAGVIAASPNTSNVVDLTSRCRAEPPGYASVFTVFAAAASKPTQGPPPTSTTPHPPPGFDIVSDLAIETGNQMKLFGISGLFSGYQLDRSHCAPVKSKVDLSRHALPSAGVYKTGYYTHLSRRCVGWQLFTFRVRITNDSNGVPVKAELAVVAGKKARPLAYVRWTPGLVQTYAADVCKQAS